jgi:hypothetical protein
LISWTAVLHLRLPIPRKPAYSNIYGRSHHVHVSTPSFLENSLAASVPHNQHNVPLAVRSGFYPRITLTTPTRDVLCYVFAPPENAELVFLTICIISSPGIHISDQIPFHLPPGQARSPYDYWGEEASQLQNDSFKAEYVLMRFHFVTPSSCAAISGVAIVFSSSLKSSTENSVSLPPPTFGARLTISSFHPLLDRFSLDLVEVFFQIVHTRIPLLNPAQFRNRFQHSLTQPSHENPLHPALVATVLAWGAKFSEHPLLVADRRRPGGQRLLAKELISRARDLAEALKVHRIPTPDHVVIGLLIEPLQSRQCPSVFPVFLVR